MKDVYKYWHNNNMFPKLYIVIICDVKYIEGFIFKQIQLKEKKHILNINKHCDTEKTI